MATNEVYRDADSVTLPVLAGVEAGEVVKVGAIIGVALTDRAADGTATVRLKGGFRVPVAAASYVAGDGIYGHASDGSAVNGRIQLINKTATTGTLLGVSLETKTLAADGDLVIALAQV